MASETIVPSLQDVASGEVRPLPLALILLFLVIACSRSGPEEPEIESAHLQSVSVRTTSLVVPPGGGVELPFQVEDTGYAFNYDVGSPQCQVRLEREDGSLPQAFELSSIALGNGQGSYIAILSDLGVEEDYDEQVRVVVVDRSTGTESSMASTFIRVKSEVATWSPRIKTGLPVVYLETEDFRVIDSKEDYLSAKLRIKGESGYKTQDWVGCQVKGRGNTTWGWPKKPYTVKLDSKTEILGMSKHKRWVLLANFLDRTLMRNLISMKVASLTSLAWTPHCVPVELVLNGRHEGSYLLIEQIRVDKNRVDITEMSGSDNSGDSLTGGYLLELDFHYDNEVQWVDPHGSNNQWGPNSGVPFGIKSPDPEDLTQQQLAYIKQYVYDTAEVLYGDHFTDPAEGYARYIDVDSFVDYWLVFEIMGNHELGNPGSVYFHKDRGGKLVAGPCWDFDWGVLSYKASPHARTGLVNGKAIWYERLFQDPVFAKQVRDRFVELLPELRKIPAYIDESEQLLEMSAARNFIMWNPADDASMNGGDIINGDERMTFHDAVALLRERYQERLEVLSRVL